MLQWAAEEIGGSLTSHSRDYLLLLNDPARFAQKRRIRDKTFVRYLRAHIEALKVSIRDRAEVARRAQNLLGEWQVELGVRTVRSLTDELDDDALSSVRAVRELVRRMALPTGEMNRVFYDLFPGSDEEQLRRFDQRARKIFANIELPRAARKRLRVCRLCNRVFVRSRTLRARQEYCSACQRRWSKQERWYRSGGKEKLQLWRAERAGGQKDETARTR